MLDERTDHGGDYFPFMNLVFWLGFVSVQLPGSFDDGGQGHLDITFTQAIP
jgi:hypothetical protein